MKVVLLKDVKNLGKAGTVQNVSDGHALNLLIPRGQAVLATAAAAKRAETVQAQDAQRRELDAKLISDRLAALAEERIVIAKKANDKGHLYDAVDAKDIAAATRLPVETIHLEKPFKEVGTFEVPVSFGKDFGKVSIIIEAQ